MIPFPEGLLLIRCHYINNLIILKIDTVSPFLKHISYDDASTIVAEVDCPPISFKNNTRAKEQLNQKQMADPPAVWILHKEVQPISNDIVLYQGITMRFGRFNAFSAANLIKLRIQAATPRKISILCQVMSPKASELQRLAPSPVCARRAV